MWVIIGPKKNGKKYKLKQKPLRHRDLTVNYFDFIMRQFNSNACGS
jgi:hypothetical protein